MRYIRYLFKGKTVSSVSHRGFNRISSATSPSYIARALAKETKVIVADEPTGNLDVENSRQIIELLSSLSKDRLVIMVTHNYDEADSPVFPILFFSDNTVLCLRLPFLLYPAAAIK